jgi:hypothetical protein
VTKSRGLRWEAFFYKSLPYCFDKLTSNAYERVVTNGMSLEQRAAAYRNLHFTKANFRKVEAEIVRVIKKARNDLMTAPRI